MARALAALSLAMLGPSAALGADQADARATTALEAATRSAIVTAVQGRLGDAADVRIEALTVHAEPERTEGLTARPAPRGRLGRTTRFLLFGPADPTAGRRRARVGYADALVRAEMEHVRVVRRVPGGTTLAESDVVAVTADVGEAPLERLPGTAEVVGARTRRAIEPGVPVTGRMLTIPPLVSSGEAVITHARIGAIEARGRAIAAQRGHLGDVIRVVNPESGRRLRGRVVGRGQVEVLHEP